jgi:hypothetical protein
MNADPSPDWIRARSMASLIRSTANVFNRNDVSSA